MNNLVIVKDSDNKRLVIIRITVPCKNCTREHSFKWKGPAVCFPGELAGFRKQRIKMELINGVVFPVFTEVKYCRSCKKRFRPSIPKKSIIKWMAIYQHEIKKCWREEVHKYIPKFRSENKKGRKAVMNKKSFFEGRQRYYSRILQDQ